MDIRSFFEARENEAAASAGNRFTDRLDYKDAFWRNLDDVCLHPGRRRVLHFYGFGGVGKTMLCEELAAYTNDPDRREDREFCRIHLSDEWFDKRRIRAIYFSFEGQTDAPEVLKALSALLLDEYKIPFRYFWFAYYRFIKLKRGEEPEPLFENKRLDESTASELLTGFTEMFSDFLPFGNFIKLGVNLGVKAAGAIGAGVSNASQKGDPKLRDIQGMTEEQLRDMLPAYFALDFSLFREKEQKKQGYANPIVIILDTFEQLTNALYDAQSAKVSDSWLWETRGVPGIIPCMSDCLWIIAGQRRIEWGKRDPEHWTDEKDLPEEKRSNALIESHLLGNLAKEDAEEFLIKSGVIEPPIREAICERTEGIPIWLDFYVDVYRSIEGEKDVEEFRLDERKLADRFIGNQRGVRRDMLERMVLLKRWSRREEPKLSDSGLITSQDTFSWLLELSFFNDNGQYVRIHDKVREVLSHAANRGNRELVYRYISESAADKTLNTQDRSFRILQKLDMGREDLEALSAEEIPGALDAYLSDNEELIEYMIKEREDVAPVLEKLLLMLDEHRISCVGGTMLGAYLFCSYTGRGDMMHAAVYLDAEREILAGENFDLLKVSLQLLLLRRMSVFCKQTANKGEMLVCMSRAFGISRDSEKVEHEDLIHSAVELADAYDKAGDVIASARYLDYVVEHDVRAGEKVTDNYRADIAWTSILYAKQAINREDYSDARKRLGEAKEMLDAAEEFCGEAGNALSYYYNVDGRLKSETGELEQAEQSFVRSLEQTRAVYARTKYIVHRENIMFGLSRLASFYDQVGKPGEALKYLREALSLLQEMVDETPSIRRMDLLHNMERRVIVHGDPKEQTKLLKELLDRYDALARKGEAGHLEVINTADRLVRRYLKEKNLPEAMHQIQEIERRLREIRAGWAADEEDYALIGEDYAAYRRRESRRRARQEIEYVPYLDHMYSYYELWRLYYRVLDDRAQDAALLDVLKKRQQYAAKCYEKGRDVSSLENLSNSANALSLYYLDKHNVRAALPWALEDHRLSAMIYEQFPSHDNAESYWISLNMLIDVEERLYNYDAVRQYTLEKIALIEACWHKEADPKQMERLESAYEHAYTCRARGGARLFDLAWFEKELDRLSDKEQFLKPVLSGMNPGLKEDAETQYDALIRTLTRLVIRLANREDVGEVRLAGYYLRWIEPFGMIDDEKDRWDLYLDRRNRLSLTPDPGIAEKLRAEMAAQSADT